MFGKTVKGKVSYMWDLRDPWVHPGSATHWDVLAHSTRPSALMTSQFYFQDLINLPNIHPIEDRHLTGIAFSIITTAKHDNQEAGHSDIHGETWQGHCGADELGLGSQEGDWRWGQGCNHKRAFE